MKICETCIMPDTYPGVIFEDGECDLCRRLDQYLEKIGANILGRDELLRILTSEHTTHYDCVVPLSGGKDSSYILYYVVKNLHLKPLAVFFDNGFISDYAKTNIKEICERLNVDLVIGEASPFRRKIIKEVLLMSKCLGRIVRVCSNCENNIRTLVINETTKRNIPFVIWGSSEFEDSTRKSGDPKSSSYRETHGTIRGLISRIKNAQKALRSRMGFKNKCKFIFHASKFIYYFVRDNISMKAPEGWKKISPFLEVTFKGKDTKIIYFFDYIEYDPYKTLKTLKEEVNWKAPSNKESRMDCKIKSLGNYQSLRTKGITSDGVILSRLVRHGLITREEAIEKEELLKKDLRMECEEVCKEFNIEISEIIPFLKCKKET